MADTTRQHGEQVQEFGPGQPLEGRAGLITRIVRYVERLIAVPPADNLADHSRLVTLRNGQVMLALFTAGTLLGWPTDYLFFGDRPEVIESHRVWRISIPLISILGLALAPLWRRRLLAWTYPAVAALGILLAGLLGLGQSGAGGLDEEWFRFGYFVVMGIMPLPMPLGTRVLVNTGVSLSFGMAYFGRDMTHVEHGALPAVLFSLGFATLGSILMGHIHYRRVEEGYRQNLLLADLNRELERRVATRTGQLRRLAAHLEHSSEEERRRLARELHDEAGQLLTGMQFELELARDEHQDDRALLGLLERLSGLVQQVITAQRRIIASLRPQVLDELGLGAAIRWYAEEFKARTNLPVTWQVEPPDLEIGEELSSAAFRILQEALTNVVRHASASQVEVSAVLDRGAFVLTVSDDGVGFDTLAIGGGRFGLLGMQERAEILGGELEVCSAPGEGTRIRLRLPPS